MRSGITGPQEPAGLLSYRGKFAHTQLENAPRAVPHRGWVSASVANANRQTKGMLLQSPGRDVVHRILACGGEASADDQLIIPYCKGVNLVVHAGTDRRPG